MTAKRQRGFTLIEALIALLVLSIGLLGVAAMQLNALQSAHMGYQRSVVSLAAVDAQERVWGYLAGNESWCPGLKPSDGNALSTIENKWKSTWFGGGKVLKDNGSELRDKDADGNGLADCEYEVSIKWKEARGGGDGDFVYRFRLPEINE